MPVSRVVLLLCAAAACAADGKQLVVAGRPTIREGAPACASLIGFVHVPKCGGTDIDKALHNTSASLMLAKVKGAKKLPRGMNQGWFHATALEQRWAVGQEVWSKAYTFAFVRNPWARHVSLFLFNAGPKRCGNTMWFGKSRYQQCTKWWRLDPALFGKALTADHFRQWVHRQKKAYPPGSDKAYRVSTSRRAGADRYPSLQSAAQYPWLADESGKLIVNEVFKLEELERHWGTLQAHVCGLRGTSYADYSSSRTSGCAGAKEADCKERRTASNATRMPYQEYYDEQTRDIIAEYMALDITNFNYYFQ
eukprot:TRINITY_DN2462_c0_g1_i2.p1 TRINITY_DN2462_c0_g1~~TRINITY_DN2462_c0_g1_i2.p1  ORF type:complete len:339 (+),score=74.67 TRINITY_DN2462_c0_g1_i2:95-1018(+)